LIRLVLLWVTIIFKILLFIFTIQEIDYQNDSCHENEMVEKLPIIKL
jgi:hypothetical protein